MSKIASIQRITGFEPIDGRDRVHLATVLGWKVMVRKEDFKVGDLCIYVEIDTLLPEVKEFEFLRDKGFKVKTQRYKTPSGITFSQGIVFPLSTLKEVSPVGTTITKVLEPAVEGTDVTELLGASHYEKPLPACLAGTARGHRPSFVPRTDEDMVQSVHTVLDELVGVPIYITVKADGSSGSYYLKDGRFGACSRKLDLEESDTNSFWQVAKELQIKEKLEEHGSDLILQGELVGPGIQKNHMGLEKRTIKIFNIRNTIINRYLDFEDMERIINMMGLQMVTVVERNWLLPEVPREQQLEAIISIARAQHYQNGEPAEGIVIRPMKEMYSKATGGRLSFKVMNPDYLVKHQE